MVESPASFLVLREEYNIPPGEEGRRKERGKGWEKGGEEGGIYRNNTDLHWRVKVIEFSSYREKW